MKDDTLAGGLPGLSVKRPHLAAVMNILIIIAGISALLGVEVRELPDIDRPIVSVRANYPGASPTTVDAEVTSKVERAVARVNGVVALQSSSEEGNFRMRVEFQPDQDLSNAANDLREAVSRISNQLPDGVEDLRVVKSDRDASPVVQVAVWSDGAAIDAPDPPGRGRGDPRIHRGRRRLRGHGLRRAGKGAAGGSPPGPPGRLRAVHRRGVGSAARGPVRRARRQLRGRRPGGAGARRRHGDRAGSHRGPDHPRPDPPGRSGRCLFLAGDGGKRRAPERPAGA